MQTNTGSILRALSSGSEPVMCLHSRANGFYGSALHKMFGSQFPAYRNAEHRHRRGSARVTDVGKGRKICDLYLADSGDETKIRNQYSVRTLHKSLNSLMQQLENSVDRIGIQLLNFSQLDVDRLKADIELWEEMTSVTVTLYMPEVRP